MNRISGQGKRFDNEPKLNFKKVFATIAVILVIAMIVISIKSALTQKVTTKSISVQKAYFTVFTNDKWGVIDNSGEIVISPEYDEMIIIPDKNRDIFICTYNVDYTDSTYNTKVLNSKNEQIFSNYNKVEAIENYKSKDIWYETDILKVEYNGKYGLINFDGKEILPTEYDNIYALEGIEKSIIVEKEGKKGLVNNSLGELILETNYDDISSLSETYDNGYIVKDSNGKYGVIGADNTKILDIKYDSIDHVCGNDMYAVTENGTYKLINKAGESILESGLNKVISINGENLIIQKDNKYGVISSLGQEKIPAEYESLRYIFENNYIAKKDGKFGVISSDNIIKVDFKYATMDYIKDADFIQADNEQFKTEVLNRNFDIVLSDIIISEINTENGYLRIRVGDNYKYYNFKFEEKRTQDALVTRTLFLVKENGKYGYENNKGKKIVDCIYDDAREQNEYGFCAVKKDGVWGVLKENGAVLVEPKYNLDSNLYINFVGEWHLHDSLNVYTK